MGRCVHKIIQYGYTKKSTDTCRRPLSGIPPLADTQKWESDKHTHAGVPFVLSVFQSDG